MQTIVVEITTEGEVSIESSGFQGRACEEATRPLEQALGVRAGQALKPEYHQPVVAANAFAKQGG